MNYLSTLLTTVIMLTLSNIFMTFAWYGHLKYKQYPLLIVILVSWGIAFFEYCLQVPANRIGHTQFSGVELKTMQEVITVVVFIFFSILYLGEPLKLNHYIGLGLIIAGTSAVFYR